MNDKNNKIPKFNKSQVTTITWVFTLLITIFLFQNTSKMGQKDLSYSEFKTQVRNGAIKSVHIKGNEISGTFSSTGDVARASYFKTILPSPGDSTLIPILENSNVEIRGVSENPGVFMSILVNFLPWIFIFGFFYYSSRKLSNTFGGMKGKGGGMFPGSGKNDFPMAMSDLSFKDVAGSENAKKDLFEVVDFLKNPTHYTDRGATLPKGVLLVGPPGTGKTLMAKAVAGEAEVPFYYISGSEFIEMFVGVGASRVRTLFETAKKSAPSIIFIDEIDSIGRSRGTGLGGGHDEREQTLNQILAEMDGFNKNASVIVMAATNRPDVLDAALVRPGRFDRQIMMDLPLVGAREKILKVHSDNLKPKTEADLRKIAQSTVGFSGADLKNLVNEAVLISIRAEKKLVDENDFEVARDKIIMGNPREEMLKAEDKEVVAIHEAGHALVAILTPGADPVKKVTILPRGRALGFTEQTMEEDKVNLTKSYLLGRLAVLLGGRLAEKLIFNEITTGAENDLKQASKLAKKMVVNWGMSDEFGLMSLEISEEHAFLGKELASNHSTSEKTLEKVDDVIHEMLKSIEEKVTELLKTHKKELLFISSQLIEKETITFDDIKDNLNLDLPPEDKSLIN